MEIYTKWKRPDKSLFLESGGRPSKIDKTGHISTQKRIENLLAAGKRLIDYRTNMYDFPEGTEPDYSYTDPTRARGLDPADMSQAELQAQTRVEEIKARQSAEKASQGKSEVDSKTEEKKESPE